MTFFSELNKDSTTEPKLNNINIGDVNLRVGDCHNLLETVADDSVALVLFSPPYDSLRVYGGDYSFDLHLLGLQVMRVLRPGGIAVMVIQDQIIDGARSTTSIRTTLDWCDNSGFKLFDMLVYSRHGAPGASSHYRFRTDHEYMPVFLKGDKPAFFDPVHLAAPSKTAGNIVHAGRRMLKGDVNYGNKTVIADTTSRGTIWHYAVGTASDNTRLKFRHPATFSDRLAYDHVKCWTEPGALVVDPFVGSGSTAIACLATGRRCIGFDVNPEYIALAQERCTMMTTWKTPAKKPRPKLE